MVINRYGPINVYDAKGKCVATGIIVATAGNGYVVNTQGDYCTTYSADRYVFVEIESGLMI